MIEILFGDSACGSLKVAQRYGKGKYSGGSIGVMVSHPDGRKPTREEIKAAQQEAEERARLEWEKAVPLGGNTRDIYGFHLVLSIGDISETQPGIKRRETLEHLYGASFGDIGVQAAQELIKNIHENLEAVRERIAVGESLRIWYSNQPDELCGLYWLLWQLEQWQMSNVEVSVIKLPEWEVNEDDEVVRKKGWGEVAPGEWHQYIALQQVAPLAFKRSCASHWQELQRENAPLRAMLNGELVSMQENLYDDFILQEIASEDAEFHEARIIGGVLGNYQLGISDAWIALRIEEMIRAGKFEIVSGPGEDMPTYHRLLRKCTH